MKTYTFIVLNGGYASVHNDWTKESFERLVRVELLIDGSIPVYRHSNPSVGYYILIETELDDDSTGLAASGS